MLRVVLNIALGAIRCVLADRQANSWVRGQTNAAAVAILMADTPLHLQ